MHKISQARVLVLALVFFCPFTANAAPVGRTALSPVLDLALAHPEFRDALVAQMVNTGILPLSERLIEFDAAKVTPDVSLQKLRSAIVAPAVGRSGALQAEAAKVLDGLVHAPAELAANRERLETTLGTVNLRTLEAFAASMPGSAGGAIDLSDAHAVENLHARVSGLFDHSADLVPEVFAVTPQRYATYGRKRVKSVSISKGVIHVQTVTRQFHGEFRSKFRVAAGIKQDELQYQERTVKVIAQDMRSEIRAAIKAGILPAAKYFVKITWMTGGDANSAIDVTVKNAPENQHQKINAFLSDLNRQYNLRRYIDKEGTSWITQGLDFFFGVNFRDPTEKKEEPSRIWSWRPS